MNIEQIEMWVEEMTEIAREYFPQEYMNICVMRFNDRWHARGSIPAISAVGEHLPDVFKEFRAKLLSKCNEIDKLAMTLGIEVAA